MEETQQPLLVRLTVLHHARRSWLLGVSSVCNMVVIGVTESDAKSVLLLFTSLMVWVVAWKGSETDWREQPLVETAQGLQLGTLFQNLRAPDLKTIRIDGCEAELQGHFVTLRLRAHEGQAPELAAILAHCLSAVARAKEARPLLRSAIAFGVLGVGTIALIRFGPTKATIDTMLTKATIDTMLTLLMLSVGVSFIAQGIEWLRKRGSSRL